MSHQKRDRLPPLEADALTEVQRRAAEELAAGPRGGVIGPFVPLLRSPELLQHAQRMGEYLRYRSAIGTRLSELVILLIARYWSQRVEWSIHAPIAAKVGIAAETIGAIAAARRPEILSDDETIVYEFCFELNVNQDVSDSTFERTLVRFGEQGVVDLIGLNGYYTLLAMVMNAAHTAPAAASVPPLASLPPRTWFAA
ncbi:MAG TPA: carboxymuconolactone decarboxylase family protein [Casimicrobiaceae bacterium]|jgi:4-carboxymuconolactone decarboxylase